MFDQFKEMALKAFGADQPKEEGANTIAKLKEKAIGRNDEEKADKYKEEVIAFVMDEFKQRQTDRIPLELKWRLNINFLQGNQNVVINSHNSSIEPRSSFAWWEEREVFNQIAPIVETRLAKLNRTNVSLQVRPASGDADDISAAKISKKVLEATGKRLEIGSIQKRADAWSEKTGSAVFKTVWNSELGRVIGRVEQEYQHDESKDRELNAFEQDDIKKRNAARSIREGDVETVVVSPFEIYPDSIWNSTVDDCHSIIHAKVYPKDDVYAIWGKKVKGGKHNVFTLKGGRDGDGGIGQKGSGYTVGSASKDNSALVLEFWEMPSEKYGNGRLIVCTEDELLHYGELPYQLGDDGEYELPFDIQKCIDVDDMFFGESIITRLIPLQRRYNSLRNRKKEYLNRAAIGQILYEEGSVDEDMLELDGLAPGQMIPYQKGFTPPQYMNYPPLPGAFETEEQSLNVDFNKISGVSEISRDSRAPVGIGSGVALSILQEQDDTRLSLAAAHIQDTRVRVGKKWLKLYKQYADQARILKNTGKNNVIEVLEWDRSDIRSTDVFIESSSALSETPAQRRQFVFDLLQAGLFQPEVPNDMRMKVFDMLELGHWETFDDDINLHLQRSKRENAHMLQGEPAQIKEFDDDETHINTHNNYRLTSEYEEFVRDQAQVDDLFEEHIQAHIQAIQMKNPQLAEGPPEGAPEELPPEEMPV